MKNASAAALIFAMAAISQISHAFDGNLVPVWPTIHQTVLTKVAGLMSPDSKYPCIEEIRRELDPVEAPNRLLSFISTRAADQQFKFSIVVLYRGLDGKPQRMEAFSKSIPESDRQNIPTEWHQIQPLFYTAHYTNYCDYKLNPPGQKPAPRPGDGNDCNGLTCNRFERVMR